MAQHNAPRDYVREIAPKASDFPQWYTDVILKSEMADYAPVRGCMVLYNCSDIG